MAEADLQSILARLRMESLDSAPFADQGERIELLAAEELKKRKKDADVKQLATVVRNWKNSCAGARAEEERIWYKDIDMYEGRQFTEWSPSHSAMVEPVNPDYEPRIAVNITESVCRTEIAKTGSTKPTATVLPASRDQKDIMAALAGEQLFEWWYREQDFQNTVFAPANLWRTVTGNGFIKVFNDPNQEDKAATEAARRVHAEKRAQQQAQQVPFLDPEPAPVMGKIVGEPVSPFHLFVPDLAQPSIQKQPYVLHVYTMPVEQVKLRYKDYLPEGFTPTVVGSDHVVNTGRLGIKGGNGATPDAAEVIEAWVKPGFHPLLPNGGLVITISDEIVALSDQGIPYTFGEYPFSHLTGIEQPGRFYRKSIVHSLIPLQNELNRIMAQIIKHKNLATKPMFFYDEGSTDPTRIRSRAGTYIPIRLGSRYPQPVPIQQLPTFIGELIDRIRTYIEDLSGQHQVSRAVSPGADTAASALAFLSETDDNYLTPTFSSITSALQNVARWVLSLMVQYWDAPRFVRVTGDDGAFDAKMFASSDIESGTDIWIEEESMLPKSKSARVATITDWIEKGIVPAEAGLEAMEMGNLGKVYQRIRLDRDAARRENLEIAALDPVAIEQHYMVVQQRQQMQQEQQALAGEMAAAAAADPALGGQPGAPQPGGAPDVEPAAPQAAPMPNPLDPSADHFFPIGWMDNDAIHIEEHKAYAKSQAYAALPDLVKKELELHTRAHETRLANLMNPALGAPGAAMPQGSAAELPGGEYAGAIEPQQATA